MRKLLPVRETGEKKPEGGKDFVYKARVVQSDFDWGRYRNLNYKFEDLVIYEMHVRGFTKDASSGVKGGEHLKVCDRKFRI